MIWLVPNKGFSVIYKTIPNMIFELYHFQWQLRGYRTRNINLMSEALLVYKNYYIKDLINFLFDLVLSYIVHLPSLFYLRIYYLTPQSY